MYSILLKNANIIDHSGEILRQQDIYIMDNHIAKVIDSDSEIYEVEKIMDCSKYFITPGLVNLHTHAAMNIFKGIAEDVDIDDWFNKEIWPYESKINGQDVYYGTILAIMEMLDSGVTAFADHYFNADMVIKAILDTGIKGDIAPTLFGMAPNFDEQLAENIELINRYNNKHSNLHVRFGPHSPYTCNEQQLKSIAVANSELGVGIHIHVAETKDQVDASLEGYGRTPLKVVYDAGLLDKSAILAHGLWMSEDDVKYLKDDSYVVACPKTYMKLSMGEGNLWRISKEINTAIGTDGSASSNNQSPIEQARLFALLGKYKYGDAKEYDLKYIWRLLMKGHDALNFNSGKLVEGYSADLLIWDLERPNTVPVYNPLASIIYSSNNDNIICNMVDGIFLKEEGSLNFDLDSIIKSVKERVEGILKRGKGEQSLSY